MADRREMFRADDYDWVTQDFVDVRDDVRVREMSRESLEHLAARYLTILRKRKEKEKG